MAGTSTGVSMNRFEGGVVDNGAGFVDLTSGYVARGIVG